MEIPLWLLGLYCEAGDRPDIFLYIKPNEINYYNQCLLKIHSLKYIGKKIFVNVIYKDKILNNFLYWERVKYCSPRDSIKINISINAINEIENCDEKLENDEYWEFFRPNKLASYGMADGDISNKADYSNRLMEFNLKDQLDEAEYQLLERGFKYDSAFNGGWDFLRN